MESEPHITQCEHVFELDEEVGQVNCILCGSLDDEKQLFNKEEELLEEEEEEKDEFESSQVSFE